MKEEDVKWQHKCFHTVSTSIMNAKIKTYCTCGCYIISLISTVNVSPISVQNQVQNLAIRGQQGATTSSSQTQTLQALSLKQSPVPIQPTSLIKNSSQGTQAATGGKTSSSDSLSDGGKKGDGAAVTEVRAINMSRSVTAVGAQPLIAPGKLRQQSHSLKSSNDVIVCMCRCLLPVQLRPTKRTAQIPDPCRKKCHLSSKNNTYY